ncbi:acetolactate synthase large subunit [Mycolicibacterium neoaurum]|uniref:acetolactate synthase n=1 Tax=Mycolicibacterium neoaurum TaxID=1795 RepID=A0AAV2WG65_MYCNE|nr:acetolactate synthase large subunit [Mycolicibacterium neoaurum]CDQ43150.1 acetohydroxyacid synthase IlvX [Mycolicibacterium neoaurum]
MASGADTVLQRLLGGGVDVCFANPGTSEMHFVAALDNTPQMRAVLCLFEGVATGAADGYARIAGHPAATLLHLGPGLANGLANLHNARRAHTPVVNIVGDHATHHVEFDAPLQSDIEALAGWPDGVVFPRRKRAGKVATGARMLVETFPARLRRGKGIPAVDRLGYLAEQAEQQLTGASHLVLVGARAPVAFFAYPGKPSGLVPIGVQTHVMAPDELDGLVDQLGAGPLSLPDTPRPELPKGPLTAANWAQVIGALLPPDAIISDEANTSGVLVPAATAGAPAHDVLTLTGGAIGQGLPVAVGAAVAAPDRPVIALQADGSALYTISALWTMARENLDITVVILNNHAYAILQMELARVGAGQGEGTGGAKARSLLDIGNPDIDFVAIAAGFGVPASRAGTAEELAAQFSAALAEPGPHLIDAAVPAFM